MAQQPARHMRLEDLDVQDVIAKGSFGIVYKAIRKADGKVFALKQVSLKDMKKVDREEAIDEARILSQLNHAHITRHYDSFIDKENRLNIVMEYATKGSLHSVVRANKGKTLPEDKIWKYFIQTLIGVAYLHSKKIIHRDIKSMNIFLDAADNVKIGDLGIARALSGGSDFARTIVGTPYYLSPELCEDKPYNEKSDVWALGVLLYECAAGRYPFEAQNEGALIRKILRGQYPPVGGSWSPALHQVLQQCMTFQHVKRPDAATLLQSPIVKAKASTLKINLNPPAPKDAEAGNGQDMAVASAAPAAAASAQPERPPAKAAPIAAPAAKQSVREHPSYQIRPPDRHPFELDDNDRQRLGQAPASAAAVAGVAPARHDQRSSQPQPQQRPQPLQRPQSSGAAGQLAAPVAHTSLQDNMHELMKPGYEETDPSERQQRLDAHQMPPAGYRPSSSPGVNVFGKVGCATAYHASVQEHANAIWTAKYELPSFGRRRCPELQSAGTGLRSAGGGKSGGGGAGGGGGYVPAPSDTTSYCSTSHYTSYYRK